MVRFPLSMGVRRAWLLPMCLSLAAVCGGCGDSGTDPYIDNVSADTSLAKFVCSSRIASAPGVLTLLPVGTTGAAQTRGYAE